MALFKILDKKYGYTVLQNYLFRDRRLSDKDIGVLCFLLSKNPKTWKYEQPGIAVYSTDKLATVKSSISHLKACGYLDITPMKGDDGKIEKHIYFIREIPKDADESATSSFDYIELGVDDNGDPVKNGVITIVADKKSDYTIIGNFFLNDRTLSWAQKGMLCRIMSLHPDIPFTNENLARLFNESKRAVGISLNGLIEHGYITRDNIKVNGKYAGTQVTARTVPVKDVDVSVPEAEISATVSSTQETQPRNVTTNKQITYISNNVTSSKNKIKTSAEPQGRGEAKKRIENRLIELVNDKSVNQKYLKLLINQMSDVYAATGCDYPLGKNNYDRQTLIDNFEELNSTEIRLLINKAGESKINVPAFFMMRVLYNGFRQTTTTNIGGLSCKPSYDLKAWTERAIYDKLEHKKRA